MTKRERKWRANQQLVRRTHPRGTVLVRLHFLSKHEEGGEKRVAYLAIPIPVGQSEKDFAEEISCNWLLTPGDSSRTGDFEEDIILMYTSGWGGFNLSPWLGGWEFPPQTLVWNGAEWSPIPNEELGKEVGWKYSISNHSFPYWEAGEELE